MLIMKMKMISIQITKSIKELVDSKMTQMINTVDLRVLINHNGPEKKITTRTMESCGDHKCKTKMKMKTIWNIYGAPLLIDQEQGLSIKMIIEEGKIPMKEKLLKEKRKVLLITTCLIQVKHLGVLNVEVCHKSIETKKVIDPRQITDFHMITRIQQLEHLKIILMIYKNNFLIP